MFKSLLLKREIRGCAVMLPGFFGGSYCPNKVQGKGYRKR
jgi:hypothetical protein